MTGAVGLVLAIACANVAILLLVAGRSRVRETAVRLALGANRYRLFQQAWIESLLLSLGGGAIGVGLTALGVRLVRAIGPTTIPRLSTVTVTWNVVTVAVVSAVLASLIAGLIPAIANTRVNLGAAIDDGAIMTRSGVSVASARRGQWMLSLAQLVLVTVLVIGSGLLLRSLVRLLTVDVGWNTDHVIGIQTFSPTDPVTHLHFGPEPDADVVLADLRRIPNVEDAAMLEVLPTGRGGIFLRQQYQTADGEWHDTPEMRDQSVTDTFFDLLGMRLSQGRRFNASDVKGAPRVVIVNNALASLAWPGQNPIGKRVGSAQFAWEVVGVVNNVRYDLGSDTEPQIYFPWRQMPHAQAFVVRYRAGSASPQEAVLDYLKRLEPANVVASAGPLGGIARKATVEPRFYAVSLSVFAGIALLLAAVGVYGVSAHMVGQRTREFGVRLALGARPQDLRRLVIRSAGLAALTGIILGAGAAMAVTSVLQSQLFEISPLDALTFISAPLIVSLTALLAAWGPAHRAGKIDPSRLLRTE